MSWFLGASANRKAILKLYVVCENISDLVVDNDMEGEEISDEYVKRAKNKTV